MMEREGERGVKKIKDKKSSLHNNKKGGKSTGGYSYSLSPIAHKGETKKNPPQNPKKDHGSVFNTFGR